MAETANWQEQLTHLQARLEGFAQAQIQSWHMEHDKLLRRAESRFEDVGVEMHHVYEGPGQPLREVRTPKDLDGMTEDFAQATARTREDREWREVEQTPAYQAWERERTRPIHEPDADELGWQAEQRFYAEQDPASQWYREDLYHGQMGPDVLADYHRTAEEERLGALEEMAFDEAELRRAIQEPIREVEVEPWGDFIEIDTSNPQMEEGFQAFLARLDQRLEALTTDTASATQQMQHKQGMRY